MFDNNTVYLEDILCENVQEFQKIGEEVDEYYDIDDVLSPGDLFSYNDPEPELDENLFVLSEGEHEAISEAMKIANESHKGRDIRMVRVKGEYIQQESRFYV